MEDHTNTTANADEQAVIFDMDGVLIDSFDAHFESWKVVGERDGVDVTREGFLATFGRTSREAVPMLWPADGLDDERIKQIDDAKEAAFRDIISHRCPEMPGVRELLTGLRAQGWKMAVASSGPPENVRIAVDHFEEVMADGTGPLFGAVVTGADVARGKPDPEVFLTAAARLGVDPARCVVVEDAAPGLRAAKAADMACVVLVSTGHTEAEYAGLGADITIQRYESETINRMIERFTRLLDR